MGLDFTTSISERRPKGVSDVLLCHSPPYCLETGSLTEPGLRLGVGKPSGPPWSYRCVCPTPSILGGCRDLNSGPQALVTAEPSSAPLLTLFH